MKFDNYIDNDCIIVIPGQDEAYPQPVVYSSIKSS